eukprot:TRINITY_DN72158_c0_g1_i1.p1 TRINITY_DN72158_c0_g1~~TRINITY_DN72158_c0_g1_i1.p1  ORF type:complete len:604 (+),score=53.63 TRINITY_DN72158_c0_g1_i1:55-1866(+)
MKSGTCALCMLGAGITINAAQFFLMKAMTEGLASYWAVTTVSLVSVVIISVSVVRSAGVVLGRPEVPMGMNIIMSFVVALLLIVFSFMMFLGTHAIESNPLLTTVIWASFAVTNAGVMFLGVHVRGIALFPFGLFSFVFCSPDVIAAFNPGRPSWVIYANLIGNMCTCAFIVAGGFTTYLQDQRLCYAISFYLASVSTIVIAPDFGTGLSSAVTSVIIGYGCILLGRRARVLPPALQKCKFGRLGYLRNMLASGQQITRCQEMPDDAFGDVGKAAILIIISHRWLNHFTCDIIDSKGQGVRMSSMLKRLSVSFPETWAEAFQSGMIAGLRSAWNSLIHGGSDVLLFFDFMGLPQIGITEDGKQIPRTREEADLFNEALQSMGAFYGMYPVLVVPEVTAEVHPYFSSGWCSSEFYTAMLAKQLDQFSEQAVGDFNAYCRSNHLALTPAVLDKIRSGSLAEPDVVEFNKLFSQDLQQKKLYNEGDRSIIGSIVEGFLLRRLLTDAISTQNVADVERHLEHVKEKGLGAILHQAVDSSVDTFLHLAVRLPSMDIVQLLLRAGADPTLRNRYGDTPTLWYMWPRMSPGARLCRSWQSDANAGYQALC